MSFTKDWAIRAFNWIFKNKSMPTTVATNKLSSKEINDTTKPTAVATNKLSPKEINDTARNLLKVDFEKTSQKFNALNNLISRDHEYGESLINNALKPLRDSAAADTNNINVKGVEKKLISLNAQVLKDKRELPKTEEEELEFFIKELKKMDNDYNPSSLFNFSHFKPHSETVANADKLSKTEANEHKCVKKRLEERQSAYDPQLRLLNP